MTEAKLIQNDSIHLTVLMAYLKTNEEAKQGPPEAILAALLSLSSVQQPLKASQSLLNSDIFMALKSLGFSRSATTLPLA